MKEEGCTSIEQGKTGVPSSQRRVSPTHYISLISTSPNPTPSSPDWFAAFVASRCRAYVLSEEPLGVPVEGIHQHGCNCYSSREALNIECIMPGAWKAMLEWLERVHADLDYYEARLVVKEVSIDELDKLKDLEDNDSTEEAGETEG